MIRDTSVSKSSWKRIQIISRKEFSDIISGKRLWILIGILVLMYIVSMSSLRLLPGSFNVDTIFSNAVSSVSSIASLLGIALGYDAIARERESGTLRLLLSRPVYRDDVINGKILSSIALMGIVILVSTFLTSSIAIVFYGISVSLGDFVKLVVFSISAIALAFSYYSISLFLSVILKKSNHALFASLFIWAVFTLILPLISSIIAILSTPLPPFSGNMSAEQILEYQQEYYNRLMEKTYEINSIISSPSINFHYSNIVNQLFPQSLGGITVNIDVSRMFPAYYISIIVLILYPVIFTILSYIMFVRSEEK